MTAQPEQPDKNQLADLSIVLLKRKEVQNYLEKLKAERIKNGRSMIG